MTTFEVSLFKKNFYSYKIFAVLKIHQNFKIVYIFILPTRSIVISLKIVHLGKKRVNHDFKDSF